MKMLLFIWFLIFSYTIRASTSLDTLAVGESIQDGKTLVSSNGIIEVGFFSPQNSTRRLRYLGIWYRNVSPLTVVWVANKEKPLQHSSGVLTLNEKGILMLLNDVNSTIWSSNASSIAWNSTTPIAQLLDTGNLVVKNRHETEKDVFLWQSFDYPGDTLMPGMKLGWDLETGLERFITSWKSVDDPAKGEFTTRVDLRGYPQVIMFNGSDIIFRSGPWNGHSLAGSPGPNSVLSQFFVFNEKQVYYEYQLLDRSIFSVLKLMPYGPQNLFWTSQSSIRQVLSTSLDECQIYAFCGANSVCTIDGNNHSNCECMKGYAPKFPEEWNLAFWSNGCIQKKNSSYIDGFLKYTLMKVPDTSSSWFSKTLNLEECRKWCLRNSSCVAYANIDIRNGGSGCLIWFNNLIDVRKFSQWGQDLYVRIPPSELDQLAEDGHRTNKNKIVGITLGVIIFGLITFLSIWIMKNPGVARKVCSKIFNTKQRKEDLDLTTFDLSVLVKATENFSSNNKLGEGGFGPVYKGTMIDGQEIAVKRLSKKSGQGLQEFKNEAALIAKLQHRNLVKLLGCCIEGGETMLIYEYMPNKSLDYFVFDEIKRKSLDWIKRFDIINGIARGLLYLHRDSRLRIVHRDLKASNILLDANLDPKISDFGLARTFFGEQVEENTNRVAGTYGYMPPEYARSGHFSTKSDVFSYGVIVLEIVSGKKNRDFSDSEYSNYLLGYAWRLWTEERALELLDESLGQQCTPSEVVRCIQIALLCVQQRPEDRPEISSVVLMLINGEKLLPKPKVPGFYTEKDVTPELDSSLANHELFSTNELSITEIVAR
ncbi:G-type lectin S-receptor-like serine/threonine-protein kinase At4g27290 isoform X2 [Medicago truncatula]|nr:G-type lectin S-receptor-like serine/threonine-protein kinase At4g27290 isoform X2 [Medicago truncatula]